MNQNNYDTFSSGEEKYENFSSDHKNLQHMPLSKVIGVAIILGFFVLFGSLSIHSISSLRKDTVIFRCTIFYCFIIIISIDCIIRKFGREKFDYGRKNYHFHR